jgi:hypothetical protein
MSAKKIDTFNKVYRANIEAVRGKKPTDIAARAKAMFELWRDTLAPSWNSSEELLANYEAYLQEQKLI